MFHKLPLPRFLTFLGFIFFLGFFPSVHVVVAGETPQEDELNKEALNADERTLAEILEEEKSRRNLKIDDFLKEFDKGFAQSMGEKFEDILKEEEFVDEKDEISTDSFEVFNEEFDRLIEEDLADFGLFDIDADELNDGLQLQEVEPVSVSAPPQEGTST